MCADCWSSKLQSHSKGIVALCKERRQEMTQDMIEAGRQIIGFVALTLLAYVSAVVVLLLG
jgi:hypothetical protein